MRSILYPLLLLALVPLAGQFAPPRPASESLPAEAAFHVEPYLQLPAPDAMTVMWETTHPLPGRVEFGLTPELGKSVAHRGPAKLHQLRLTGLQPGTRYHYRVRSGDLVSDTYTLKTAPPPGTRKWRLALYGDSRSNPFVHRLVAEQIAKHDVDLVLHTGDIVTNGKDYESWRTQFFAPIAPYRSSVPWISTIGNHEADADNYFSYAALPGNERHFGFDYGNAHFVCLDSNGWMAKDGRDVKQRRWLEDHLRKPRGATWTFVVFHHPLFSAHATRPINPLRWDWAPVFLDPANRVDGVLNGHDHFYARNYPMAKLADGPTQGVLFMTSAGGGAWLYPIKQRDYIARTEKLHHFTLFAFDGDRVIISAIDMLGEVFDRWELSKGPTPADQLCAYEIEELRRFLVQALAAAKPVEVSGARIAINAQLQVPTRFQVPVKGVLRFQETLGWKLAATEVSFALRPREPLTIPLRAEVEAKALGNPPKLTIEFEPGRFRNRIVELYPFKLTGPGQVTAARVVGMEVDGRVDDPAWGHAEPLPLLTTTMGKPGTETGEVRLANDGRRLFVAARLSDARRKVRVRPPSPDRESSRQVLLSEHVRVELSDGRATHTFALSAEHIPYYAVNDEEAAAAWHGSATGHDGFWTAEMMIPLSVVSDRSELRVNVVHRSQDTGSEFELRPTFGLGQNPDVIPDWKSASSSDRFARLRLE